MILLLLLAKLKNFHLPNSQLALTSTDFLEYVQTALLAEGAERGGNYSFYA